MRHRCPQCASTDNLWVTVDLGEIDWPVDERLEPVESSQAVEWYDVFRHDSFGCFACEWTGAATDLVQIGIDGEPLPRVHPAQMRIGLSDVDVAAA